MFPTQQQIPIQLRPIDDLQYVCKILEKNKAYLALREVNFEITWAEFKNIWLGCQN